VPETIMLARLSLFLCVLAASTPAAAADVWECTFSGVTADPSVSNLGTVKIEGQTLLWSTPGLPRAVGPHHIGVSKYRILENNTLGIVAVEAYAENWGPNFGLILRGDIFVLNKADGGMREGDVAFDGVREMRHGQCHPKQDTKPNDPGRSGAN
jgi:hypothetical protein